MIPRDFSSDLRQRLETGTSLDDALSRLRSAGASFIDCIKAVKTAKNCDFAEAKRLVHSSNAWSDFVRNQNKHFHEEIAKILEDES